MQLLKDLSTRRLADVVLFAVTLAELIVLFRLVTEFTPVDWIYVVQHLVVLGIAFTRRAPAVQDHSLATSLAVAVACVYPYAQVICLHWLTGHVVWLEGGLVLVVLSACLSLASLLWLGTFFGFRPALRGLATTGPYGLVRHPMYLSYLISDIGYNLDEWNLGTGLIVLVGWASLIWRILAEERVLSQSDEWAAYVAATRYRLVPGIW